MLTWVFKVPVDGGEKTLFYHTTFTTKDIGRTKHALVVASNGEIDFAHFKPAEAGDLLGGRWVRVRVRIQNNPEYGKSNTVADLLPMPEETGSFS